MKELLDCIIEYFEEEKSCPVPDPLEAYKYKIKEDIVKEPQPKKKSNRKKKDIGTIQIINKDMILNNVNNLDMLTISFD